MSAPFPSLVRPFQTQNTSPAVADVTPGQKSTPPVLLNFGRSGSGKTMSGSYNMTMTFYMKRQEVEKSSSDPSA